MTEEECTLYQVDIQTSVSPQELRDFSKLLENAGYSVVTDLNQGLIELRDTAEGYSDD